MPILDGLKAGKKIVQDQLASSIVFLSAYSDVQNTDKAKKLGALGYFCLLYTSLFLIQTRIYFIMNRKTEQRLITKTRKVFLLLEEALTNG